MYSFPLDVLQTFGLTPNQNCPFPRLRTTGSKPEGYLATYSYQLRFAVTNSLLFLIKLIVVFNQGLVGDPVPFHVS